MEKHMETLQITMDGFSEILSELKNEIRFLKKADNGESALKTDLLNKIIQTIDESRKGITAEELQAYSAALVTTIRQLQDEANASSAGFLNEKIEQLEQMSMQPSIVKNQYTIDFASSKTFVGLIVISLALFGSLYGNYDQHQANKSLTDNDLKYRYVLMKSRLTANGLEWLEKSFPSNKDSIRIKVLEYEEAVRRQAQAIVQKQLNDDEVKNLNRKIEKLKE